MARNWFKELGLEKLARLPQPAWQVAQGWNPAATAVTQMIPRVGEAAFGGGGIPASLGREEMAALLGESAGAPRSLQAQMRARAEGWKPSVPAGMQQMTPQETKAVLHGYQKGRMAAGGGGGGGAPGGKAPAGGGGGKVPTGGGKVPAGAAGKLGLLGRLGSLFKGGGGAAALGALIPLGLLLGAKMFAQPAAQLPMYNPNEGSEDTYRGPY